MEYIVEIGVSLTLMVIMTIGSFIIRKINLMDSKITDHEARLQVEESKGTARDKNASEIKTLLHTIAEDIGTIKQEQGYWRGRHEQESRN